MTYLNTSGLNFSIHLKRLLFTFLPVTLVVISSFRGRCIRAQVGR